MIFNINEISKKIEKKIRRKRPEKIELPRPSLPRLSILPPPPKKKAGNKIFKIAKTGRNKRKATAKIIVNNYHLNKTSAKVLLALLYWSGGSKYPSSNFVAFSNSDANLAKTFLNLLRSTFSINESKIRIHLQLYEGCDEKKIIKFWNELLKVPKKQFYKPTFKKLKRKAKQKNYFGTCTIRYYSLDLLLTIMEIYEELANIF